MYKLYKVDISDPTVTPGSLNKYSPLPPIATNAKSDDDADDEDDTESDNDWGDYLTPVDFSEKTIEDIFEELRSTVFPRLVKFRRFNKKSVFSDVYYIYEAANKSREDRTGAQMGEFLTSLNFLELVQKVLKRNLLKSFDDNYPNVELLRLGLEMLVSTMWNISDKSVDICKRILKINMASDMFKYMQTEHLRPEQMFEWRASRMVQAFIGTLHNVVQKVPEAKQSLRACDAVDVLQPFRECTTSQTISCISLLIQAYLVNEEENERINSNIEVFYYLLNHLEYSLRGDSMGGLKFAPIEIVEVLNKLAMNDNNKKIIVESGVLPYYVKLMAPDWEDSNRPGEEDVVRAEVAHGLWILAFKCKEAILKNAGCIEGLELLSKSSAEEVRRNAEGALWVLKEDTPTDGVEGSSTSTTATELDTKHIFISYQRDSMASVSKINNKLKSTGFKTWMDIDDMSSSDSCLEGMAKAVENAKVVIICYSEKYKDSANCRTEAEYAFRLKKPVIPLRFQTGYYPDGWLGILIGSKHVYDCSQANKFEDSVQHLIKDLTRLGTSSNSDAVDGVEKKPKISPSHEGTHPVTSWTREDINNWIKRNELDSLAEWFSTYNGKMLFELQRMRDQAPEAFFAYFIKNKHSLEVALTISNALQDLN